MNKKKMLSMFLAMMVIITSVPMVVNAAEVSYSASEILNGENAQWFVDYIFGKVNKNPKTQKITQTELNTIREIQADNKGYTGVIPKNIKLLTNLYYIKMSFNNLSGSIPKEIGQLSNLQVLILDHNKFGGSIPLEIGNCKKLVHLWLDNNQLTGGIPKEICLSSLENLLLQSNNLTGEIPKELFNATKLIQLSLSDNGLSGTLSPNFGKLVNLDLAILSGNNFTGTIPVEFGNCKKMRQLWLSGNQLSGSIPRELGNMTSLKELYAHSNKLTGGIPLELGKLSNLYDLQFYNNQLSGSIPKELGNASALVKLLLDRNQLSGEIPKEIGQLKNLEYLYLHQNQLTGEIPSTFQQLTKLKGLGLKDNRLYGNIPSYFITLSKKINNIGYFNIGKNFFTGNPGDTSTIGVADDFFTTNNNNNQSYLVSRDGKNTLYLSSNKSIDFKTLFANIIAKDGREIPVPSQILDIKVKADGNEGLVKIDQAAQTVKASGMGTGTATIVVGFKHRASADNLNAEVEFKFIVGDFTYEVSHIYGSETPVTTRTNAEPGQAITADVVNKTGYVFKDVTINAVDGNGVPITHNLSVNSNNRVVGTMPNGNVTIEYRYEPLGEILYMVRYYKDSVTGTPFKTVTDFGTYQDVIPVDIVGNVPEGYYPTATVTGPTNIGLNGNIVNVVYNSPIPKYSYIIEYRTEDGGVVESVQCDPVYEGTEITLTQEQLNAFWPGTEYEDGIQVNAPAIIVSDNQIISVVYKQKAVQEITIKHYGQVTPGSSEYTLLATTYDYAYSGEELKCEDYETYLGSNYMLDTDSSPVVYIVKNGNNEFSLKYTKVPLRRAAEADADPVIINSKETADIETVEEIEAIAEVEALLD